MDKKCERCGLIIQPGEEYTTLFGFHTHLKCDEKFVVELRQHTLIKTNMEEPKMEEELKLGIGTEEFATLKPGNVTIAGLRVDEVGVKKAKKVVCICKHPDKVEPVNISSIKYEFKGKLESVGLWINKDSKGLIRKGSALATLLQLTGSDTVEKLVGKSLTTTTDEKGYLTFKGY